VAWKPFLGLSCIIPLLECIPSLSKFVQVQNVFICDFVDVIKACEGNLYKLYVDPITSYGHVDGIVQIFFAIVHHSYDPLHMVWIFEPNFGVEYLGFQFFSHTYMVHTKDVLIGYLSCVYRLDCLNVVEVMKQQCTFVIVASFMNLSGNSWLKTL
jgi:hypothetical protein